MVLALAALVAACGRGGLSQEQALDAIRGNTRIAPTDAIVVEAISHQAGATEAIAKTAINGTSYNLKLRLYDRGWTWEFVETVGGTWVSPDVMIAKVREEARAQRVEAWAAPLRAAYAETADMLSDLSANLPNERNIPLTLPAWDAYRRRNEREFRKYPNGVFTKRLLYLLDDPRDAWGTPPRASFDSAKRTAVFGSAGPDRKFDTVDDLDCVRVGRLAWDDALSSSEWAYDRSWRAPEGLDVALAKFTDDQAGGRIESRKAIE